MSRENWVFMPHAGHFIGGNFCQFRLNTWVGKYIVSTIGELQFSEKDGIKEIGMNRKYETMVFRAVKSKTRCCPYRIRVENEVDFRGYNTANDATKGHMELCEKWSRKRIKTCKICGKEIPIAEVFNSNPLSIASYFTLLEYRGRRHWCLKCTMEKMESYKKQKGKP
jgi:hypothetical protein